MLAIQVCIVVIMMAYFMAMHCWHHAVSQVCYFVNLLILFKVFSVSPYCRPLSLLWCCCSGLKPAMAQSCRQYIMVSAVSTSGPQRSALMSSSRLYVVASAITSSCKPSILPPSVILMRITIIKMFIHIITSLWTHATFGSLVSPLPRVHLPSTAACQRTKSHILAVGVY